MDKAMIIVARSCDGPQYVWVTKDQHISSPAAWALALFLVQNIVRQDRTAPMRWAESLDRVFDFVDFDGPVPEMKQFDHTTDPEVRLLNKDERCIFLRTLINSLVAVATGRVLV